jgi:hypothetical protein
MSRDVHLREGARSLAWRSRSPSKQPASPRFAISKWKSANVIDLNQAASLSFISRNIRKPSALDADASHTPPDPRIYPNRKNVPCALNAITRRRLGIPGIRHRARIGRRTSPLCGRLPPVQAVIVSGHVLSGLPCGSGTARRSVRGDLGSSAIHSIVLDSLSESQETQGFDG